MLSELTHGAASAVRAAVNAVISQLNTEETYDEAVETSAAAATGTLSVTARTSVVALDGTDARALPAPTFAKQYKTVTVDAGANTPVLVLTVTGVRVATQNVWTSGTWNASTGPLSITFYSPDGLVWDLFSTVGSWSVA